MATQTASLDFYDSDSAHLHGRLGAFSARRLKPAFISERWQQDARNDMHSLLEEGRFIEDERHGIEPLLRDLPLEVDAFMQWFENLTHVGPGQDDALFPWLAQDANYAQMRWFLKQEIAGEAGFDDLVALTQMRFDAQPKLEMARNYWDEMGRGNAQGMHGAMLERSAHEFNLRDLVVDNVWEAVALANLMTGLALNRRYAYQSVGALGAIEMTAPGRVALVNEGLKRLGVSAGGRQYFQLHAGLDVRHSEAWNREVIRPLVARDVRTARPIAEGALMRLQAGARCFARYRRELAIV